MGLTTIPNLIALDVGLAIRLCHKSVIIKYIKENEKKQRKKPIGRKKTNEEKEKKI